MNLAHLKEIIEHPFEEKDSIEKKLTSAMFALSFCAVLVLTIITFASIYYAKEMSREALNSISDNSYESSSDLIRQEVRKRLINISADNAASINNRLQQFSGNLRMAASQLLDIEREPWRYVPQDVPAPSMDDAGRIAFYYQHAPGANLSSFQGKMRLMANMENILKRCVETNPIIDSIFVTFPEQYTLSVDNNISFPADTFEPPDVVYDASNTDWYKLAVEKGSMVYTPVRRFAFQDALGLFCAVPCYDSAGKLRGVAAAQTAVYLLADMLKDLNLHDQGFCFIVDKRGYVILSSRGKEEGDLRVDLRHDLRKRNDELGHAARRMSIGDNAVSEVKIDGKDYFLAYAPIQQTGWGFATAIDKEIVLYPVDQHRSSIASFTGKTVENMQSFMMQIMFFFVLSSALLLAFAVYSGRRISRSLAHPIQAMARAGSNFSFDNDASLEANLERIRHLDIRSGDEIEELYRSFFKVTEDGVRFMKDINRKNETIRKMHTAFLQTIAELVEYRDLNTGEHIKKTAAYVGIILDEMKREGIYKEQLTPQFISNVIQSAPMHDVGKINVSDVILNKPGRLTPEEFEIMKTHAPMGGKIIANIRSIIPDSEFLYEAENLAAYHHEKWDGSGYPEGLSGEAIPLSARVMAVADVFDALISKRCYKDKYSYETSLGIIREGSGSHFDPQIVQAFFAAKDRILQVSDELSEKESSVVP